MRRPTIYFARLLSLLQRHGRSIDDAEDLIQEALLRLTEYHRTTEVRNEGAFLERAVINLSIDSYRRERSYSYAKQGIGHLASAIPLADARPAPDEVLDAEQRLDEIRRVLDAISTRTREIYLAHRAGYSYAELSVRFRISVSTIEKTIARAVLALMDMKDPQ